ncbi:MAG: hypothetical protein QXL94_00580 [Candidatus Parvarchaeum sp.]
MTDSTIPPSIWCVDLDGTISNGATLFRQLMTGLHAQGAHVIILTGVSESNITNDIMEEKKTLLNALELRKGIDYDQLVIVSGPQKKVAEHKVNYMRHVGASALIDNDKRNIKAAKKAGFFAFKYSFPKLL